QHDLPENIEEGEIQGDQGPDHAGLEHEKRDRERTRALLDVVQREEQRDRREQNGQEDEEQRDPVHTEGIRDAESRDPGRRLRELKGPRMKVEPRPERQREGELDERSPDRKDLRLAAPAPREEEEESGRRARQEDENGQDPGLQERGHAVIRPARSGGAPRSRAER